MVSFLISVALVSLGDLGVALTLCHTGHSQVHADLAALTLKVGAQTVHDLLGHTLSLADAHHMLGHIGVAGLFHKSGGRSLANGALSRDLTFSNVTTNGANIFLHKNRPPSFSD
jgi:phage baseplate assembly protein gpV